MMRRLAITIAVLLALAFTAQAQTFFPLDSPAWAVDPQQTDQITPNYKNGTLRFWFPYDPNYAGYLLLPWSQSLTGSQMSATMQILTYPVDPTKSVRFVAPYNGGCVSPSAAHLYFQTGPLYNDMDGSRWWSNPNQWELVDGSVTLTVSLDPSQWSSTFGHFGTELPAQFQNALAHPTYVGVTFGGSCSFGHGVQTRKGDARFKLLYFACQ